MRKIRVVIAKPGLDGHDRGAKVIARALRDAGMEVIYTGLRQTPEQIVSAALQEDADVIGLSILSGAHNAHLPAADGAARGAGARRRAGGRRRHHSRTSTSRSCKEIGIKGIFLPGTPMQEIIDFIGPNVRPGSTRPNRPDFTPRIAPGPPGPQSCICLTAKRRPARLRRYATEAAARRRQRHHPARHRADVRRRGRARSSPSATASRRLSASRPRPPGHRARRHRHARARTATRSRAYIKRIARARAHSGACC